MILSRARVATRIHFFAGQVVDTLIINRPSYGIYNFHRTDLTHDFGAGPTPAEDLAARGATTTVWTIHQVTEAVDADHIVATGSI